MTSRQNLPQSSLRGVKRPVLWLLLVVSTVCNLVANTAGGNMFIGAGFGLVALGCAAALISQHYRKRRALRP